MPTEWFWIGVILLFAAALILPRLVPEPIPTASAEPTPLVWKPERRRWCQSILFGGGVIEVCLDGDATGPSADAMGGWLDLRSQLDDTWQTVIRFAIKETAENGVQIYEPDELGLSRVDLCPEDPIGGGDTVFTFEAASDPGTTFIVPMRDGRPLSLQRAS